MAGNQNIKFEIKGIQEVNKILSQLPKEINDRIQFDIHKAAGRIVQKEIQNSAPEGDNSKSSKSKIASNVIVKKSDTKSGVLVGFTKRAWYVKLLEWGTKVRKLKGRGKYRKGTNRGQMPRKPFIERAHQSAYPKAVDYITKNYLKIINRSLKRLARRFK